MNTQLKFLAVAASVLAAGSVYAQAAGTWLVRAGATTVAPQVSSGCLSAPDFGDSPAGCTKTDAPKRAAAGRARLPIPGYRVGFRPKSASRPWSSNARSAANNSWAAAAASRGMARSIIGHATVRGMFFKAVRAYTAMVGAAPFGSSVPSSRFRQFAGLWRPSGARWRWGRSATPAFQTL
jgi:hypothetical protein